MPGRGRCAAGWSRCSGRRWCSCLWGGWGRGCAARLQRGWHVGRGFLGRFGLGNWQAADFQAALKNGILKLVGGEGRSRSNACAAVGPRAAAGQPEAGEKDKSQAAQLHGNNPPILRTRTCSFEVPCSGDSKNAMGLCLETKPALWPNGNPLRTNRTVRASCAR